MASLALAPGAVFADRFEISELVGSGGMGTVYRACDRHTGGLVALKLLSGVGAPNEAERFLREGRLLSEVKHRGVVGYVAHGQDTSGALYLAMEWLVGRDLAKRLQQGYLSVSESLMLLSCIAEALVAPHQLSIVHRDIKPSNIFLRGDRLTDAVLLDFGIARRRSGSHAVTGTGALIGTPDYMSPEQARGARDLSPATDIFSLGCVMYECLTGKPPFHGDHLAAVLVKVLFEQPQSLAELRATIPGAVSELLSAMLEKDPLKRPADAMELLCRLQAIQLSESEALAPTIQLSQSTSRFGEDEQGLVSMVVATPPQAPVDVAAIPKWQGETITAAEEQVLSRLIAAIKHLGGDAEVLLNRSLVVSIRSDDNATDQAARAAKIALQIREMWPDAVVVLATGRASTRGQTPVGEVADRAAQLLLNATAEAGDGSGGRSGVWLDRISAGLLERRFIVSTRSGVSLLESEDYASDQARPLLGKPTQCVGREAELGILEMLLSTCVDDSEMATAIITGAPGVGKSRLRHEFLRRIQQGGKAGTTIVGHASAIGAGQPYSPLADGLRRLCGLRGGESAEYQRHRLRERIGQKLDVHDVQRVTEFIGEMCGIPSAGGESLDLRVARSDPRAMARQIAVALGDFLRAETRDGPLLLMVEDLQWSDPLTVRCIEDVLASLREVPLMMVATARPEVYSTFPKLWKTLNVREIKLQGISRKAAERFVAQMLGRNVTPETLRQIIERAEGNALFLEELVRAAAEVGSGAVPDTMLAMLQARLARLDAGVRRVLKAASVIGSIFWDGAIVSLLDGPSESIRSQLDVWLSALHREEYIERAASTRFQGQVEYRFSHALMREAAYDLLTDEDRYHGHVAIARFLLTTEAPLEALVDKSCENPFEHLLASPLGRRALEQHAALFDIVYHLQQSTVCTEAHRAHTHHAELNLMAAMRAEASNALDTALSYAEVGKRCLGESDWDERFDLCFQLFSKLAEYAHFSRQPARTAAVFQELEQRLTTFDQLTQYMTLRYALSELLGIPFDGPAEQLLGRLLGTSN